MCGRQVSPAQAAIERQSHIGRHSPPKLSERLTARDNIARSGAIRQIMSRWFARLKAASRNSFDCNGGFCRSGPGSRGSSTASLARGSRLWSRRRASGIHSSAGAASSLHWADTHGRSYPPASSRVSNYRSRILLRIRADPASHPFTSWSNTPSQSFCGVASRKIRQRSAIVCAGPSPARRATHCPNRSSAASQRCWRYACKPAA